ncbi:uncharacterized protein LOC119391383 [Rhipicephalus sanguineus]|uniref:uncharacterized protein LOC119391383 n=1 Tax=Rhipicephalus sanguineus TaxID=34632 RepID=UPI0018947A10|nr:uncharacterized protein LOC119391383 [Rhipicephalus sanguineus]
MTYKTHLDFTKTCREMNVVPRSLQLKRLVHTAEGNKIIAKAEQRLLNARIHECHSVFKKELDLFFLRRQLRYRLPNVFPSLEEFARNVAATTARKQQLSPTEHSVLAKRYNFNVTTAHPSLPRIIAATEEGIRRLDNGIRENVRLKAIGVLSKIGKRREHNISRKENNAIRSLRNDENIVIPPADKGNAMVVLDREAYSDQVRDLLHSPAYETLAKDPTSRVQRELNKLLADIFKRYLEARTTNLQLICRSGSAPGFYGLPKIHKPTVPLRPIVDFTSPLRALSKYLHRTLAPLSVPIALAVSWARAALKEDKLFGERSCLSIDELCRLLEYCLKGTYFSVKGIFYRQASGTAMGAVIFVTAANLTIEHIEETALRSFIDKPKVFVRCSVVMSGSRLGPSSRRRRSGGGYG